MIKILVYLRDMCDAKHLVQAASGCEKNVDLICGRYIIDAKSMLGVPAPSNPVCYPHFRASASVGAQ